MPKRVRLCPEITDPEMRGFLDMVPQIRAFNTEMIMHQTRMGREMTIPLEGRDITISVHRPPQFDWDAKLPAVFEYHGGGFVLGDMQKDDQLCEQLAQKSGAVVIGVAYRLAPEHPYPAAFDDAYDAIRYVASHAEEFEIDPERLAVIGYSGGATLGTAAALKSVRTGEFRLCAQVLHYPYLDSTRMPSEKEHYDCDMDPAVMKGFTVLYSKEEERALPYVSPVMATKEELTGMAPALILPAERDALKQEGLLYAQHLQDAGVEVYCKVMPDAHHGYVEDYGNPEVYENGTMEMTKRLHSPYFRQWAACAVDLSAEFLKRHF